MAILVGYYGRIVGRCGLENVHVITVINEMIDLDYQGNVCVVLFDLSIKEFVAETGNCIEQVIIERCFKPKFVEVSEFAEKKTKMGE